MPPKCIACSTAMSVRFRETNGHWKCPLCGLECIWPQPDDATLATIYGAEYFSHYATEADPQTVRAMKRATYERQLRRLPPAASFPEQGRLLDCGAATGFFVELAKDFGWDAFAVELSGWGAQMCAQAVGPDHIYRGEVQKAQFDANPKCRFEAITMFDFLEHVRRPAEVLQWARSHIEDSGAILLTTPRSGSISWFLMGSQWFHYTREHLWYFTPSAIRRLLSGSGFKSIEVYPAYKAITVGYALGHYGRKPTYSRLFSPPTRALNSLIPSLIKRWRFWCLLGEMAVLARP